MHDVPALRAKLDPLFDAVAGVLVGRRPLVERLLIGLLTDGHVLLEGVPGLAKTLAVRTVARALALQFQRVQFTPDLLPADVIGTQIYNPRTGEFTVKQGPVFTNVLLADEINRAPAKVQSALLEAMQEGQVTIGESTLTLPRPFFVLATQNPIEQEGTYPLPEAQLDRFLLKVLLDYPTKADEAAMLLRMGSVDARTDIPPALSAAGLAELRGVVDATHLDPAVAGYLLDVVRATRVPKEYGLDLAGLIEFGGVWKKKGQVYGVPAYWAFRMYSNADATVPVEARTTGAHYDIDNGNNRIPQIHDVPYLDVVAALNQAGDRLTLFCVNRRQSQATVARIRIAGFGASADARVQSLNAADIYVSNNEEQPEKIKPVESSITINGDDFQFTFPPASVTVLELKGKLR